MGKCGSAMRFFLLVNIWRYVWGSLLASPLPGDTWIYMGLEREGTRLLTFIPPYSVSTDPFEVRALIPSLAAPAFLIYTPLPSPSYHDPLCLPSPVSIRGFSQWAMGQAPCWAALPFGQPLLASYLLGAEPVIHFVTASTISAQSKADFWSILQKAHCSVKTMKC